MGFRNFLIILIAVLALTGFMSAEDPPVKEAVYNHVYRFIIFDQLPENVKKRVAVYYNSALFGLFKYSYTAISLFDSDGQFISEDYSGKRNMTQKYFYDQGQLFLMEISREDKKGQYRFYYDQLGRLIQIDDQLDWLLIELFYDEDNFCINKKGYFFDGDKKILVSNTEYFHDDNNRLIEVHEMGIDGEVLVMAKYNYNIKGLIEKIDYFISGEADGCRKMYYDKAGCLIKMEYYDYKGELANYCDIEYEYYE